MLFWSVLKKMLWKIEVCNSNWTEPFNRYDSPSASWRPTLHQFESKNGTNT